MATQSAPDDDWLDDVVLLPLPPEMQDGYVPSTHVDFSQEDRAMVGCRLFRKPTLPLAEEQEVLVPDDEHDRDEVASPPLPTTPMDDDADEVMISTVDEGFPHAPVPTPLTHVWAMRDVRDASVISGSSSEHSRPVKSVLSASPAKSDSSLRELICSPFFATSTAVKVAEQDSAESPTRTAPSELAGIPPSTPPRPQLRPMLVEYEDSEAGDEEETTHSPPTRGKNGLELLKDLYDTSSPVASPAKTPRQLPEVVPSPMSTDDTESAAEPTSEPEPRVDQTPDVGESEASSPLPVPPSPPPTPSTVPETDRSLNVPSTSTLPNSQNPAGVLEECVTSPPTEMPSLKAPSSTTTCDPHAPVPKSTRHDAEDKENVAGRNDSSTEVPPRPNPARDSALQPLLESTGPNVERPSPPVRNTLGIAATLRMLSDSYAQDDREEAVTANRGSAWDVSDPKNPRPMDRTPSVSSSRGTPIRSVQARTRVSSMSGYSAAPSTPERQTVPKPAAAGPSSSATASLRGQNMTTTAPATTSSRTFSNTGWVKTVVGSSSTRPSEPSLSFGQPITPSGATTRPRLVIQLLARASAFVPSVLGGSTPCLTPSMSAACAVVPRPPPDQTSPAEAADELVSEATGEVAEKTSAEPTTETTTEPTTEAEAEATTQVETESMTEATAEPKTEATESTSEATTEDTAEAAVPAGDEVMAEADKELVVESETTADATATAVAQGEDVVMAESEAYATIEVAAEIATGIQSEVTACAVPQEDQAAVGHTAADSTPPSSVPSSSSKTTAPRIGRNELDALLSLPSKWGPRSPCATRRRKPTIDPGQTTLPSGTSCPAQSSASTPSSAKRTRSRAATSILSSGTDQTTGHSSPPAKRRKTKAAHPAKSNGLQDAGYSAVPVTPTAATRSSFQSVVSGEGGLKRSERVKGRHSSNVTSPTERGENQNESFSSAPTPSSDVPLRRDTAYHVPWSEIEIAMVVSFFRKRKISKDNGVKCWEKLKAEIAGFERTQKAVEMRARVLQKEGRIPS